VGHENAVHITAAIIHGLEYEVDVWWQQVIVNDLQTGIFQRWHDLGQ
jgi:hypothetical protein